MKKLLLLLSLCCFVVTSCSDINIGTVLKPKPVVPEEEVFTIDGDGNYVVDALGGDVTVKVTTNLEYDVVIPEDATWLTLADTRAVREETLTFTVAQNERLDERIATVELKSKGGDTLQSITIRQEGEEPVFTTDSEGNYIVKAEGGNLFVKVTTNLEYNVVIPEDATWLTIADTRTVREETLTFTVACNEELEERTVTVELKSEDGELLQSINVKQEGADPVFTTDSESDYTLEAKGGEVLVKVTTNLQYDVVISEDATWLTLADTRAVRKETLRFTASENEELDERVAVVELRSDSGDVLQSFTVKQLGADPVFTTDGEGVYSVNADGGDVLVNITTNLEFDAVVVDDVAWLSIIDTRAVRKETLTIVVSRNEEFEERSATVLLVGAENKTLQEITINQEFDAENVPDNQIWYLATSLIEPNADAEFGANILSNNFEDGRGVITFDGAVKSIANQAFVGCKELAMIALPQSVETIAEGCFAECSGLESFVGAYATLDSRALVVDEVMVAFAPKGKTSYTTPREAKRIGEYTFAYCLELVNVTVDYDTEVIGAWSFTHCEELVNAHIADSVTTIEAGAFSYCYKLGMSGAYTVEDGLIIRGGTIVGSTGGYGGGSGGGGGAGGGGGGGGAGGGGSGGGGGYGSGGTLTIPSKVTIIAAEAFKNYDGINEVVIPESVTEIYAWAFIGCRSLERVVCLPTVPPTAVFVDEVWDAFDGQHDDRKIYVPRNSVKAYREAEGWKEYADDIVSIDGIDPDTPETYMVNYTATAKVEPRSEAFSVNVVANVWDEATGEGIICFDGAVTQIGTNAFYAKEDLLTIDLPSELVSIENQAFSYCSNLKSVNIGNRVKTIGSYVFSGCDSLEGITLPSSLTTIGDGVFNNCHSIKEFSGKYATDSGRCLVINKTLYAFAQGCDKTEYTIPGDITAIGKGAFEGCATIVSVTIPNIVTKIEDWAFRSCENLVNVTLSEGVKSLGTHAFQSCEKIETITLPSTITSIKSGAFNACKALASIYCKATTPPTGEFYMFGYNATGRKIYVPYSSVDKYRAASQWSDYKDDIVAYDFEKGEIYDPNAGDETKIYYTATSKVEPYYTGEGVFGAEIISNEWDESTGEGVICFDDEVTLLGDNAFYQRTNLKSITIPESVITVSSSAFQMSGLQEIKGKYASEDGCSVVIDGVLVAFAPKSATAYTIPSSVVEIGDNTFSYCWDIESVAIPQSVKRIGDYAFYDCGALSDVSIAEGVESIGEAAFASCDGLESVAIPNSVTTIGVSLFISCENLASVEIGAGITRLENSMFDSCYMLADVTIPESVAYIGKGVFSSCYSLESITLPASIESVGEYVFNYCENLKSVYCKSAIPPTAVVNWSWGAFSGNAEDRKIYVPAESVDAYKSATGWNEYADAIIGYDFETGEVVEPDGAESPTSWEYYSVLQSGGEVTLYSDFVTNSTLYVEPGADVTINMNGYSIRNSVRNTLTDVFVVKEGAKLTINGDGVIEAVSGNGGYTFVVDGELVVNGGTYIAGLDESGEPNTELYARNNGCIYVNGGEFPNEYQGGHVLNKKDSSRTTAIIEVSGGRFRYFNPADNYADGAGTNYLAYGYDVIQDGDWYEVVCMNKSVVSVDELQAALDSATEGDNTITFVNNISGEVTISQQEGQNIIIDGAGYQFDGTIYINGNSRYNGIEEVSIRNVNFVTSQSSIAFIEQNSTTPTARYPHNITVEDCTFEGGSDVVALRLRQAMNVTVRNCAVVGLHSLAQMYGCENILIDGVWVSDATNGVSLGNTSDCVIMNSVIIASGYGVRADPSAILNIQDSEIHGAQPIVVRKMTDGKSYTVNLNNVMLHTNDLYDIIFTSSSDENEYVEPLGEWSVTGAEGYKIFPEAEVVAVANVSNEEELIAALEAKAERIYFLNDITLSTQYLNIEDIKTEIFGQGYKLTASAMSKNYSLIVSGQSDVVINDLVINDRGGFYVYGVSNLVVNNVNVRANYSSTGRFIFYVEVESTVTVNGGKYSTNRSRIHYFYTGAGSKITVTDGEFGDNISGGGDLVSTANAGIVEFKGGTFTSTSRDFDPTQWVAEGYEAIKDGDTWTVQAK